MAEAPGKAAVNRSTLNRMVRSLSAGQWRLAQALAKSITSPAGRRNKPGLFVNVSLKVPMGSQLVIPASGVLQSGTRAIAFVERSDGYIEPREVQLGSRVGDDFIVLEGLKVD